MAQDFTVSSEAGELLPKSSTNASKLRDLLFQARRNFLDNGVEIVEGLIFRTYKKLETIYYYLNSQFRDGSTNDDGSEIFFHNIINHRCSQATKNIDLDTKDMYIKVKGERAFAQATIVRAAMQKWMKETNFGDLLNKLAEELPQFGAVVWKKSILPDDGSKHAGSIFPEAVSLLDLIYDPTVRRLKDSSIVAQRVLMGVPKIMEKVEAGIWDREAAENVIKAQQGAIKRSKFMRDISTQDMGAFSITDTIPTIELFEFYGWVPEASIPESVMEKFGIDPVNADPTKYRYIKSVLSMPGSENEKGNSDVLFIEEIDPSDFPYKDCLLPTRVNNRWLPIGIPEAIEGLQVRMNELVNRFFQALRSGSLHLFQSRGSGPVNNLLQDAEDGDVIITRHEITPIAMELRAFQQYQNEINNIERQADRIANTTEVVTGEALPTNTPFRLGAQLGSEAAKIYTHIRENIGIFLQEVFNDWLIPDIIDSIDEEDIIEIAGSAEELKFFEESFRRAKTYEAVKKYILENGYLPEKSKLDLVEKAISEEIQGSQDRSFKVDKKFIQESLREASEYQFVFDPVGESTNKKADDESLGNLFQIIASNPAVTQDPVARGLLLQIAANSNISLPLLSAINAPAQPAAQAQAAAPAQQAFAQNPGDASSGAPAPVAG